MRAMARSLATLALLPFVSAVPACIDPVRVDPSSGAFVDAFGRVCVFHGVNAVYKLAPWIPPQTPTDTTDSLGPQDMAQLRSWGFNVVRLGVIWSGVDPDGSGINTTYISALAGLVAQMAGYGIHSLLDAHQDALSRKFCGEGAPDKYVDVSPLASNFPFPFPLPWSIPDGPDGYPNLTICQQINFAAYDFAVEHNSAVGALYHNSTVAAAFANMWSAVAAEMANVPGVLGYELLNEPWAGDMYSNPLDFLIPGQADINNLLPLYTQAYAAIRTQDPQHIVFYEPAVSETLLGQHTGFTSVPGGVNASDKQAFAFHIYCFNQNATGDITNVTDCAAMLDGDWQLERANKRAVGGGSFMTEFGAVGPHESSAEALTHLLNLADADVESWAYWTYKSFQDITTQNPATETLFSTDGTIQSLKLAALSRTYAQVIAAVPGSVQMSFNPANAVFNLTYTINRQVPVAARFTVVYFNADIYYQRGITYAISPLGQATVNITEPNYLVVSHSAAAAGAFNFVLQPA